MGLEVVSDTPFRLQAGRFVVGFYGVGRHAAEPIEFAFPRNRKGAPQLAQLSLPGFVRNDTELVKEASTLILAHLGNPDDGLEALHLCVPVVDHETNSVCRWAFTHPVWLSDESLVTPELPDALPPEESIEAPVIRRRKRDVEHNDET